ncbi:MAG: thiaminase II [Eubacteriales bacterium]|nr:thiaminase II [Eubacteriales bacterium]
MNQNSLTDRLLTAAHTIWEGYLRHPFVRGLADGSLPVEKFRFYLLQDYVYLFDYAKVFAQGVVRAREPAVMRSFATYVSNILNGEMDIHRSYMKRLGITPAQAEHVAPSLDNLSYTAYMRAIAAEEGPAEIMAAVLSCALSYEHIAKWIVAHYPHAADHAFYGEWVQGYAADAYAAANDHLVALLEQLAAGYTQSQLAHLTEIFVNCSRYEARFWDMAWNGTV